MYLRSGTHKQNKMEKVTIETQTEEIHKSDIQTEANIVRPTGTASTQSDTTVVNTNVNEREQTENKSKITRAVETLTLTKGGEERKLNFQLIEKDIIKFTPEMQFSAWEKYLDKFCITHGITEEEKLLQFPKWITGTALQIYVNSCLQCETFGEIKQIFLEKLYKPSTSFTSFNNLRFDGTKQHLLTYFQEKVELGRQLGLNTKLILEGLTGGLPIHIKPLIMVREPPTPTQWINLVTQLVEEMPQNPQVQNKIITTNYKPYNPPANLVIPPRPWKPVTNWRPTVSGEQHRTPFRPPYSPNRNMQQPRTLR